MESHETLHLHAEEHDEMSEEDDPLDSPDVYFGDRAKDKFWDFYKSDRKFKDTKLKENFI